ncbi:MAG: enolase C-terminal domain-like protein [Geminicoccaceae bacterium]
MVRAVRDAVGSEIMVAMDAHWKYANGAIKLAQAPEPFGPALARGPGAAREHRGPAPCHPQHPNADLHRREPLPQARLPRADPRKQAARIIAPDIPKMGGLAEAKKVADHADSYCIPIAPRNVASPIATVAGSHVCAGINNFLVIEYHAHDVEWWSDLVKEKPPIDKGFIRIEDRPGPARG